MSKAIVLLSGGIDSVVSLASVINLYDDILALTFNYKQKSFPMEEKASVSVSSYYKIKQVTVNLDWLGDISTSSLNTDENIPDISNNELDNINKTQETAKSVWVPNRNALFINIAACYAEAMGYDDIILGANKEEAQTFKDNSKDFINAVNVSLKNSANKNIKVIAPLIDKTKDEIISEGIKLNIPFNLIYSCYKNEKKHCGQCESCVRLKRALEHNNRQDIIKNIFK